MIAANERGGMNPSGASMRVASAGPKLPRAQAARVSDYTAFMYLGELVEFDTTGKMFTSARTGGPSTTSPAASANASEPSETGATRDARSRRLLAAANKVARANLFDAGHGRHAGFLRRRRG